jgi:c-di-GMP phosphodiesterase
MSIFLGRQPILDAARRRHGYELLYRSGDVESAFFGDPNDATRRVVEQALLEWGLPNLVGDGMAFINVTSKFLQSGLFTVLPAEQVVFELSAAHGIGRATIDAVREATRLGYRIALDDLVSVDVAGLAEVLPYVEIAKVEALAHDPEDIESLVGRLKAMAPHVLLLAERVETIEAFETCSRLGFELFQGYFFAKPEVVSRAERPMSQQGALVLLAALQDPYITIDDLADLADTDPTLTYRLLRLVNASSAGLANRIESVRQAIVLLGLDHVRQLAALITMAGRTSGNRELLTLAVTRAHMARQLLVDRPQAASAFTAGLLSVIDAVFNSPMAELLAELPVTDEVRDALLNGSGPIGEVLRLIHAHEQADVAELQRLGEIDLDSIRAAYGQSSARSLQLDERIEPYAGSGRR